MTTLCRDCDLVHGSTRGRDWWNWRCMAAPTEVTRNFVNPDNEPDPPYAKCATVNPRGECEFFTPIRHAEAQP
jgi:hypothetical protein